MQNRRSRYSFSAWLLACGCWLLAWAAATALNTLTARAVPAALAPVGAVSVVRGALPIVVGPTGSLQMEINRAPANSVIQLQRGKTYALSAYVTIVRDGTTIEATGDAKLAPPRLVFANGMGVWIGGGRKNVTIRDVELWCTSPTPGKPGVGISGGSAIVLERVRIEGFGFGYTCEGGCVQPVLRDCVIANNWAPTGRSSGVYMDLAEGPTITGCSIDHNGYGPAGQNRTSENQGCYITGQSCVKLPAVVRYNVFSRNSNFGMQIRCGGVVEWNLFLDNPNALSFGYVAGLGPVHPGGVEGSVAYNAIVGCPSMGAVPGANAICLGNARKVTVTGNLITDGGKAQGAAIWVGPCLLAAENTYVKAGGATGKPIGIESLVVQGNCVYGWKGGAYQLDARLKAGPGASGYRTVTASANGPGRVAADVRKLIGADDAKAPAWKRFHDDASARQQLTQVLKIIMVAPV